MVRTNKELLNNNNKKITSYEHLLHIQGFLNMLGFQFD